MSLNESIVEDAALEWFGELGYAVGHGPHLAPGEPAAERDSFFEVVLVGRLREAIRRLNPAIPEEAREDALHKVLRVGTPASGPLVWKDQDGKKLMDIIAREQTDLASSLL
jgi:type I restriction enzyme R subunit